MATRVIVVTGGVLSGLGKGIIAASLGNRLQARGYSVFTQKFDPYLNVDAGTLNPGEHGECFVTVDGAETDLDLGHYERFLDVELSRDSSIMSGQIYQTVIEKERRGEYLGKTVQVIPHITNEIKSRIDRTRRRTKVDFLIIEIGGTVGDIEGRHFLEAVRQYAIEHPRKIAFVHLAYLPYLHTSKEIKTKPVQNSLRDLQSLGIQPQLVFCRADYPVAPEHLEKIAMFAGLPKKAVITIPTLETIYEVPLLLENAGADKLLLKYFGLRSPHEPKPLWQELVKRIKGPKKHAVRIALVGKYLTMNDTYFSVVEALKAASWAHSCELTLDFLDAERIARSGTRVLTKYDSICVPGGFGSRGVEGMIKAIEYARTKKIPYLGLCYGMQLAVIEFARNKLHLDGAHTTEINKKSPHTVISTMTEQEEILKDNNYGGSMRLGSYPCELAKGSLAYRLYKQPLIHERHRHRYEFNNKYREQFEKTGAWRFCGSSPDDKLIEMIELIDHPYFIACQFHPEFANRPHRPHPLFLGLIEAALKN
ncbi:MAG: CTP synthase [Patescibacteria group bacterium]